MAPVRQEIARLWRIVRAHKPAARRVMAALAEIRRLEDPELFALDLAREFPPRPGAMLHLFRGE